MTKKPTTIRIEPEVWKAIKLWAVELDIPVGTFVETVLIHELRLQYYIKRPRKGSNKVIQTLLCGKCQEAIQSNCIVQLTRKLKETK